MEAFEVVSGHLEALIEDDEREVLAHVASEVAELLGVDVATRAGELGFFDDVSGRGASERSSWAALERSLNLSQEGSHHETGRPADPAVERLLPQVSDDPEVAEEYRRLTQTELRFEKADRLARFWAHLQPENGPLLRLTAEHALEFMAAITDIRLVLGQRLGIETAQDLEDLRFQIELGEVADQRASLLQISDVLAWWQESLIFGLQLLDDDR